MSAVLPAKIQNTFVGLLDSYKSQLEMRFKDEPR
jgi:hypothetical protein